MVNASSRRVIGGTTETMPGDLGKKTLSSRLLFLSYSLLLQQMYGCIKTSCSDGLADNNINVFLSYLQIAYLENHFISEVLLFQDVPVSIHQDHYVQIYRRV